MKHDLTDVISSLNKKQDSAVDVSTKTVFVLQNEVYDEQKGIFVPNPKKANDLGNGSWGKIAFLTNHAGYMLNTVQELPRVRRD